MQQLFELRRSGDFSFLGGVMAIFGATAINA